MVIFLGGAPCAGKGVVSRAVVERTGTTLLPLDVLKMGLHRALPSAGIDPNSPSAEVGAGMWPLLKAMAESALESGVECIFEGDMLLPEHAADLRETWGHEVTACFIGYREIDPMQKLHEIRQFSGLPNDWLSAHDDAYVLDQVRRGIDFSNHLASECRRLEFEYFDVSREFATTVHRAVDFLVTALESTAVRTDSSRTPRTRG